MRSLAPAAPKPPPHLRLLPAAAGSWIGVLVGTAAPPHVSWWLAGALSVLALCLRRRGGVAVGLIMLAAGLTVASIGRMARTSGAIADLAHRGVKAHVELAISSDPQPLPPRPHLPATVLIQAQLRRFQVAGHSWTARLPVLVLAPASSWGRLLPTTRVTASVQLRTPRGTDVAALVVGQRGPVMIRGPSPAQRWAGRVRAGLRKAAGGLPRSERGLLPGLVIGDTSAMPASDTADFRTAGLTHLVAVSGANLAVVVAGAFGLLRWSRLGIRMRAVVTAGVLVGFVALARPTPSVLRAGAMGLLALAAIALGRPRALLPALLATVTGLSLFAPTLVGQPGFALSVLATLALLVLAPGWTARLREWLPSRLASLAQALAAPMAAQVACAPVIASLSGAVSLGAVPANVLALPAVPVATVLGLLAALTSLVSSSVAGFLAAAAGIPCRWLVALAHATALLPAAVLTVPKGTFGIVVAGLVTIACVAAVRSRGGRRTLAFLAIILTAVAVAGGR